MNITDPLLHEVFTLWPAYQSLADYVTPAGMDARHTDPMQVHLALADPDEMRQTRLAALLFAHAITDSIVESLALLDELRVITGEGRRPRFGAEAGLSLGMFEQYRPEGGGA